MNKIYWPEPPEIVMIWPEQSESEGERISDLRQFPGERKAHKELTIHPSAILTCQECHHARHIDRESASLKRTLIRHGILNGTSRPGTIGARDISPSDLGEHVGLDASRSNGITGHAFLPEVGGESLGDAVDC